MAEINELAILAGNNTGRFPEGMAVSAVNDAARELEAMLARYARDTDGSIVSSGAATAYIITPFRAVTELTAGQLFCWRAHVACGANPTASVGGTTPMPLVDADDRNLSLGDIVSGQIVVSVYNASRDAWECQGIKTTMPRYTVGGLPAGVFGQLAFATNGRKNGEAGGSGTGVLVFYDGAAWCACDTGATVAA